MGFFSDAWDSMSGSSGSSWLDAGLDLYNLYDSKQNESDSKGYIQASDPYKATNQEAASQLTSMLRDGGAAYMQTEGAQAALAAGNKAYYRSQAGGGDRLSTGAAERRETQAVTLYDQIVNSQMSRLSNVPKNDPNAGGNLSSIDRQGSFDQSYNTEAALKSLGGIFGGDSQYQENSEQANIYRANSDFGRVDGWFE